MALRRTRTELSFVSVYSSSSSAWFGHVGASMLSEAACVLLGLLGILHRSMAAHCGQQGEVILALHANSNVRCRTFDKYLHTETIPHDGRKLTMQGCQPHVHSAAALRPEQLGIAPQECVALPLEAGVKDAKCQGPLCTPCKYHEH